MKRLTASGLVVRRGGRAIVDHVDVVATAGEMLAVMGPSGSGKTTLLSVLSGLVPADEGRVEVDGDIVDGRLEQRLHFGLVLQSHALVPVLDAGENVEVVLRARGVRGSQARERAHAVLDRVGLGDQRDRLVEKLSGGQQQRVAVARALAAEPELLLADEPTSELDAETRDRVIAELHAEARRGAIVVVATHDPEVAARCQSVLELVDGHVA